MFSAAYEMLGGDKHKTVSLGDDLKILRQGLPVEAFDKGMLILGLNRAEYAKLIGISLHTLQRMKGTKTTLSPMCSEHILMLTDMVGHAGAYFGNREAALRWLKTPGAVFANETPLSMCDTKTGISLVKEEINRLKYGYTA